MKRCLLDQFSQSAGKMKSILVAFSLFVAGCLAVRYDGYETIRIEPQNHEQRTWLQILELSLKDKIDVWQSSALEGHPMDVMVAPRFQAELKEILDVQQVPYHVMIKDVQSLVDTQTKDVGTSNDFDYTQYHTYDEIQQWVVDFSAQYPSIVSMYKLTTSFEGRDVHGIKLTGTGGTQPKKAVWWQGGIHAREWISPATVMWICKSMAEDYGVDPTVTAVMDAFDFYIIPSLNADGYEYTWSNDRLWRKTRSKTSGFCVGTDPNRNYAYEWGGEGASTSPCSETYRGPTANSENIIKGSTEFLMNLKQSGHDFVSFIDFHSYSQLFLYPWSYSARASLPADSTDHGVAATKFSDGLKAVYGTEYTVGPSARTLYAASGCSVDWGYATLGAKYSYVVELRDTGRYGFLLPANQIEPSGIETYAAVKAYLGHMLEEYYP
ncbi:carboxypeptidase B-like [Amphiura filiformis]|uniref:carboxypeptidase B-like n=1 Tax=Amphiura filiformis TaxID=82378 RepID=UPI003B2121D9